MNLSRHDDDAPAVVLHPPYAFAAAVLASVLLERLLPLPVSTFDLAGPFFGLAITLVIWPSWVMNRAKTGIPTYQTTTTIVDSGPFAVMRNPIYAGLILLLVSLAFLRSDLWYWLAAAAFAPFLHYGVVLREEAYLTKKFGDRYHRYYASVKRWGLF